MIDIFTIPVLDPVRSTIDASYSEIKSESTSLLLKWRSNMNKYVTELTRMDNSRLVLAFNGKSLFGVWDLVENQGYEFLIPVDVVTSIFNNYTRIMIPISKFQSGAKYFFDVEHNPVLADLKNYSRTILKEMLLSPEFRGSSNEELAIRAIQAAQAHNQNFNDYANLYHQSQQ